MNESNEFGILYVASGKRFIAEAIQSAKSVKKAMPDIPIAIFLDDKYTFHLDNFDYIEILENPTYSLRDKIIPLTRTPFEKTVFLDTDTFMIEPIPEAQVLLERFHIACAHAPVRSVSEVEDCPEAFPEVNTGVIFYRRCNEVISLFKEWLSLYDLESREKKTKVQNQPSFRKALYDNVQIDLCILTPEYNLRVNQSFFIGGNAKVKILHGRGSYLEEAKLTLRKKPLHAWPRVKDNRLSFSALKKLFPRSNKGKPNS